MGVGAAFAMPGTLSTITSVFPPEERAKAVGIWAGFAGAGGTLGMLMSGALLERFWWGSTFLVNALVAGLAFVPIVVAVPVDPGDRARSGSTRSGSVLSIVGIGALVLGIIEGPDAGLDRPAHPRRPVGGAVRARRRSSASSCAAARRCSTRACSALRGFATGSASLFLQFFAMFGFFFVAVQYLQLVLGYSALDAAVAVLPMSAVMIPLAAVAATLAERHGQRVVGGHRSGDLGAVGFAVPRHPRRRQRLLPLPVRHARDRRGRGARDDARDQRHRVVAPPRQAGRRLGGERHRP